MITGLLRNEGWKVNHKRVERIWRREGLKVPKRQPKRGRLWLNDGSCIRLRPLHRNHVWSYDFVTARTHDGRAFRMLNRSSLPLFSHQPIVQEVHKSCSASTTCNPCPHSSLTSPIPVAPMGNANPLFDPIDIEGKDVTGDHSIRCPTRLSRTVPSVCASRSRPTYSPLGHPPDGRLRPM
jgi:hypothetical protein